MTMTKEQRIWALAAHLIGCDPEDHEDDEEIQPVYDLLEKFVDREIRLAPTQRNGEQQ